MPLTIQVGTILIQKSPIAQLLGLEIERYSGDYSVVRTLDGRALDRKIRTAGWNFFFMAAEVKVTLLGALGAKKIQNALTRILAAVRKHNFNGLEVTGIVAKRFLGVPYTILSAHSRHIQSSCYLDSAEERRACQIVPEVLKG